MPEFPIRLPIQLISFNEHSAVYIRCMQQNQIRRNPLISNHLNNISNL